MLQRRVCGIVANDERFLKEYLFAFPGHYLVSASDLRRIAIIPVESGRSGEQRCDILGHDDSIYPVYTTR